MYSIKQVTEMLGIPAVTLRAWENRYHAVEPMRTDSGYRMYSEQNVEDLRWLKEQIDSHHMSISHAVRLLQSHKEEQSKADAILAEPIPQGGTEDALRKMEDQIYQSLYQFQGERANALIDFGFTMYGYDAMFYRVLVPILIRVGDAWENGRASVAQEHFMTQLISQRFYQFFHLFPIYPHLPKVLALCPQGEHHQVGLLLFSLFLRKNGAEVLYLGANTPTDGVIPILEDQKIDLVCVSVTNEDMAKAADDMITTIISHAPEMQFVLGGQGYEKLEAPKYPQWIMTGSAHSWQDWFTLTYMSRSHPADLYYRK
ncbi:MerR family transcriptional regulator [Paenibacillus sp. Marseille-Q4541]|uniref:MerR family transcriptional regulator n=1 Tax=Paenibacillus sp. Marseille-Q4541 TaxID=2831522 RepID=UPI001BA96D20|nr:MerR family transcriptional regulator [Paenibacillus sp. Marseille-Q4541]